ncbi:hypothetical protein IR083_21295 [Dysgonomonas sp. GY75]|uniref:hypothetical protein n=1 Tax=Dysgonomonas sp. GY75 TaxID=2780419 RepID=UPI00188489B4|nr:hypothetical protein [Dysgonomonas sp. GY75]MBF0651355.1 hypothetical protein [Dysgonomonas sp. GY75]
MKKNILFILSVLIFSVAFMSCSSDDNNDDNDTGSAKYDLYLDNAQQKTSSISNIEYNETNMVGEPQLKVYLYGDDGSQFTTLTMTFDNLRLADINVGDDLISKNGVITFYMLVCDKGTYTMGDKMTDQNGKPIYVGYMGQAIVKSFDKSNNNIDIEFKDTKVTDGKNSSISIKGRIKSVIN